MLTSVEGSVVVALRQKTLLPMDTRQPGAIRSQQGAHAVTNRQQSDTIVHKPIAILSRLLPAGDASMKLFQKVRTRSAVIRC